MAPLEVVARAICQSCGENPDHVDASGEPRWKAYVVSARAAINALADGVTEKNLYPIIAGDMCCATLENFKTCIRSAADE